MMMATLSFQIFIFVSSLFFSLGNLARSLSVLLFPSKNQFRLLILDLSYFLLYEFNSMKFPCKHGFTIPQTLINYISIFIWFEILLVFLVTPSLAHVLLRSVLYNLKVFGIFLQLFSCYLFLVKLHCDLKGYIVWFYSFKFAIVCFMAQMSSILVSVPYESEKNVYSAVSGWRSLPMN